MRNSLMAPAPGIVMDVNAILIQFRLLSPSVFKTVKVYENAVLGQRFDLIENINDPAIVRGKGDIQTNYMHVFIRHLFN
jgi:hypothetical protein